MKKNIFPEKKKVEVKKEEVKTEDQIIKEFIEETA